MCLLLSLVVKGGPGTAGPSPKTYQVSVSRAEGTNPCPMNPQEAWCMFHWFHFSVKLKILEETGLMLSGRFAEVLVRCVGSTEVTLQTLSYRRKA